MNYFIKAIEYYLPDSIIDNKYLNIRNGIDLSFLENKIGIKERHIASPDESTSSMAIKAATKLLDNQFQKDQDIDLLIICTQNPDYRLPTTACIVQNKLDLKNSCIAFDINLGCSGFIYSIAVAGNFIKTNMARNALVIMVDQYSKLIDYTDKNTASLFGDAASAVLLGPCTDSEGVLDATFGTDGAHADKLIAFNSGVTIDSDKGKFLFMDGREIFKFSISIVPREVNQILDRNHLNISDIKYFIFHQANKYILKEIQKVLLLDDKQMIVDLENYGNTVSSTIPIAYKNLMESGNLQKGDLLIYCGFGVGLSWGTILYKY